MPASSAFSLQDPCDWSETLEQALLDGQAGQALQILDAFARHAGPDVVLPELMVATIRRLERLWGSELVAEASLLAAFGMTRRLIEVWKSQNPGRGAARSPGRGGLPVLVCVAPGDLHTFGAQILADDLMLRGWPVDVELSPQTQTLLDRAAREPYAAIMMSVGQDASLANLSNLIAGMRSVSPRPEVQILLGGSGLEQPFAQYHFLKADLIAGNAAQGADFLASRLIPRMADTRT
ncbi:MAG: B12-binding domain-containing protein [Pararhodobacter sp.]